MRALLFICILSASLFFPGKIKANDTLVYFAQSQTVGGSVWKYLDNGSNQGVSWRAPGFNDSAWVSAASELGYGETTAPLEHTVVNAGCTPVATCTSKFITTYFRKKIFITSPTGYTSFKLSVKRDDAIVVYVNGSQVFIDNIGSNPAYNTAANGACSDDGNSVLTANLPASAFIAGMNTLAVEVHQSSATSSDMNFDMQLIGLTAASVSRGPYLQVGGKDSITIRWRTNLAADSRVRWGTSFGSYPFVVDSLATGTEHVVRIGGLAPDTKYYYTIGTTVQSLQAATSNYFNTLPPDNTSPIIPVVAFGDCGNNSTNQVNVKNSIINYTGNNVVDAWLLVGDNAYPAGLDGEYQSGFFDVYKNDLCKNWKLYPATGNHDYGNTQANAGDRSLPYFKNFSMPTRGELGGVASGTQAYYSFNIGGIHFVALDSYGKENANTTRLYDTLGAQVTWLKADLAANTKKWVVVYFHHPPYTKGCTHDSDSETELIEIRNKFIRILERYGVDLIICCHSHSYERSFLLKNLYGASGTYDPVVNRVSSSNGRYNGTAGSCAFTYNNGKFQHGNVYVVSGSSGQQGSNADTAPGWPLSFMAHNDATSGGCFYFEIDSNRLDAKFVSYNAASPTIPLIKDSFTIMKNVNRFTTLIVAQDSALLIRPSWKGKYNWFAGGTNSPVLSTAAAYSVPTHIYGTFRYVVKDFSANTCITDSFEIVVAPLLATTLSSFNATIKSNKVLLDWTVVSEPGIQFFTIERSMDAVNFTLLGKINAVGPSGTVNSYRLTDDLPLDGYNYYRLGHTNNAGVSRQLSIKKVNYKKNAGFTMDIQNIPGGQVNVMVRSNSNKMVTMQVMDITGREIQNESFAINSTDIIKKLSLTAGLYIVVLTSDKNEMVSSKVVALR